MNEPVSNRSAGASTSPPRGRAILINASVALGATIAVAILAEPLLRLRYVEPLPTTPPAVLEVQPHLVLDPLTGYRWQSNVSADRGIVFHNADIEYEPLSTDEFGVVNTPAAINGRRSNEQVQILGLGDSFMEMAAPGFHSAFLERGLFYYSLAIHRHAPPHYAALFDAYGIAMKSEIVLVGLFENDFTETQDFENWKRSGVDWFAYHSGTWCGRSAPATPSGRFVRTWLRGYEGLANVVRIRLRGERMSVTGPTEHQVFRVSAYLSGIAEQARAHGIEPWLVLIPSKPTARGETTLEARAYDDVIALLEGKFTRTVDLRPVFAAHPDPASLYYQQDGHWNAAGIALAAETILANIPAVVVTKSPSEHHESRSH